VQAVVVVAAVLAFLVQWISTEVMVQWAVDDTAYLQLLQQSVPVRWAFAFVAVALTGVITIFYQRWKDATVPSGSRYRM
jgi:hypothetical protein